MSYTRNRRANRKPKHKMVKITILLAIIGLLSFTSIEAVRVVKAKTLANELLEQIQPIIISKPYVIDVSIANFGKVKRTIEIQLESAFNELSTEQRHIFLRDEIHDPIDRVFGRWSLANLAEKPFISYDNVSGRDIQVIAYSGNQVYKYGSYSNKQTSLGDKYIAFEDVYIDSDGNSYEFSSEKEKSEYYSNYWSNDYIIGPRVASSTKSPSRNAIKCSRCNKYYEPGDMMGNYMSIAYSNFCKDCYEVVKVIRYMHENVNP